MKLEFRLAGHGRLKRLAGSLDRARRLAAMRMAETYTEETLAYIKNRRPFIPRTGHLEQSVQWQPRGETSAVVSAGAEYAPWVEYGTRPHLIRPRPGRRALRFFVNGRAIIRPEVMHPGTRPRPFFFADQDRRQRGMLAAAREAVAETLREA